MNSPHVYDKAKWHYDGDFPRGLKSYQGFVHTGMFVGWLIEHGMISEEFVAEAARHGVGKLTGAQVYKLWDGVLVDSMLTKEGNRFALAYFDFDRGEYLNDYAEILVGDFPGMYHVRDTWENYALIKQRINQRYAGWQERHSAANE